MKDVLTISGLTTVFRTRKGVLPAVQDVSFSVRRGETLGLVGESGSGKSVTGFSIMGLVDPPGEVVAGDILFQGQNLRHLSPAALRALQGNRIAMVFQDPMMTLNPVLRIAVQMTETLRAHGTLNEAEAREKARDALGAMGIPSPESRLDAFPHQLSGGMRQRVAIAIAMLNRPDLIIADEPTTALDVTIQAQILAEVQKLTRDNGTALIWISHDLSVVAGLAERIAVMYAGRIVEIGSVDDVLDHSRHPYTAGLIGSLPGLRKPGSRLAQIPGQAPRLQELNSGCAFAPRCARVQADCAVMPDLLGEPHAVRCFHPLEGGRA